MKKRHRKPPKYTDAVIIEALEKTRGMIYVAARALGCSATTIYDRAKVSPAVAQAIQVEREVRLDRAEMQLDKAVDRGEPWAVCFLLKCKAKDRGYVERQQVEHSGEVTQKLYGPAAPVDEV